MESRGGGCGPVTILLLLAAALGVVMLMSPGDNSTASDKVNHTDNDTRQVLSGNEALSRNTGVGLNLGEIVNNFYDCVGSDACTFDNSVDSSQTDSSVSNTNTDVSGQRNTVIMSNGETACENPDAPGQYSPYFCTH